jgi:predicted metal-dependent phosphoesterase TrpH
VARLAAHGVHLDGDAIVRDAIIDPSKSAGRPWIARALVAAGHVASIDEAFDRWLERGAPAFVPREAAPPEQVFAAIHEARGLASLAHPGLLGRDEWIADFAAAGLDALEAHYSEHDAAATTRYLALADRLSLAVSGGSDYHGDDSHAAIRPGSASLPREAYEKLKARRSG